MPTKSIRYRWTYDVFVSFRGEDISKGFMDHLFSSFQRKGIHAFRDDKELPRGEEISSQLYRAIEESRFLIVIFSKNYASSTWCLRELVKILKCKFEDEHKYLVRIIFYDVSPGVVRNQSESYAAAFAKHEASNKAEVPMWKEALTKAANLSGWELHAMANGFESKFIGMISEDIFQELSIGPLHVGENLVGLDARVEKMNLLRFVWSSEVQMIGICGIGGIGKTTLAKAIYNRLYSYFDQRGFCEDVKGTIEKHGLIHFLQQLIDDFVGESIKIRGVSQGVSAVKRMMVSKRVLLVLDNVDNSSQFEALAGSRDWFCPGSLIIVTSKDKQLLNACGMKEIFDIEYLSDNDALELFSLYSFKGKRPKEGFKELSDQVVQYVKGHPLALKVLGSFLYGKSVSEWESELNKLQRYPNAEIQQVLRLSFDGLDPSQKSIFLDIAFAFKGEKKSLATKVLEGCNFFPETNIRVLIDRSLITISSDMTLEMHDLLQRMACEIVREESRKPRERSRLSFLSEVCEALNRNQVTEAVEVLVIALDNTSPKLRIHRETFTRQNNIRILKIWDEYRRIESGIDVDHSKGLGFFSHELRWLCWHGYPFKFLPSSFHPESLVALDLSYSLIKNVWRGTKSLAKLKLMKLMHCRYLTNTPDFTEIPNLEDLDLEGCINLVELHPSVGILNRLVVLNMKDCLSLSSFPNRVEWESLEVLILSACSKLEKLPEALGKIKTLLELRIDRTAMVHLPSFISSLSNLQVLSLGRRVEIRSKWWASIFRPVSLLTRTHHPGSLAFPFLPGLHMLKELDVSHCNLSEVSPDSIGCLPHLIKLNLSGNSFTSLPESLSQLSQLTTLGLVGCKNLEALPDFPRSIQQFDAMNCTSLRKLPSLTYKGHYLSLDFTNCPKLVEDQTTDSLFSMLFPQGRINRSIQMDYVLPGSRIPQWYKDQSVGDCVKVGLPPDWCYDKFLGFDTAVVLTPKEPKNSQINYGQIGFDVTNFDNSYICLVNVTLNSVFESKAIGTMSDVIWLSYRPSYLWEDWRWKEAKHHIKVSFRGSEHVKVKKCGIRLLYAEDGETEDRRKMIQWLPPPVEDGSVVHPNHADESAAIDDEPPLKKSRIL